MVFHLLQIKSSQQYTQTHPRHYKLSNVIHRPVPPLGPDLESGRPDCETIPGFGLLLSTRSHPLASIQLGNCGLPKEARRAFLHNESAEKGLLAGRFVALNRFFEADSRIWES